MISIINEESQQDIKVKLTTDTSVGLRNYLSSAYHSPPKYKASKHVYLKQLKEQIERKEKTNWISSRMVYQSLGPHDFYGFMDMYSCNKKRSIDTIIDNGEDYYTQPGRNFNEPTEKTSSHPQKISDEAHNSLNIDMHVVKTPVPEPNSQVTIRPN